MGGMLVPARIYATEEMIPQILRDKAPQQVANVAHLPGIVHASSGDAGHPLGLRLSDRRRGGRSGREDGVVSPGGVGYDINCGVRLLRSRLTRNEVAAAAARARRTQLFRDVPTGVGPRGALHSSAATSCTARAARAARAGRSSSGYGSERRSRAHRGAAAALTGPIPRDGLRPRAGSAGASSSARSARAITSSRCRYVDRDLRRAKRRARSARAGPGDA